MSNNNSNNCDCNCTKSGEQHDPMSPNLLFIRFSSLGDVILTTGVIKAAHEALPHATISVITRSEYYHIYEACPFVDNIYTIPKGVKFTSYRRLLRHIRDNITFHYIIDLHHNTRSHMLGMCFRTARRKKYTKNSFARRLYAKTKIKLPSIGKHVVLKYYACLYATLKPLHNSIADGKLPHPNNVSLEYLAPHIHSVGKLSKETLSEVAKFSDNSRPTVVLAPFASKHTKHIQNYTHIMRSLAKVYNVVLVGVSHDYSPLDMTLYAPNNTTTIIDLVGRLEISDLLHVISTANVVVSADSGITHAASALQIPLVTLFCGTDTLLGFAPAYGIYEILEINTLKCRPCSIHGKSKCKLGDFPCSTLISPAMVLEKVSHVVQYKAHTPT